MSTKNKENPVSVKIIDRMMEAAGVKNHAQLSNFLNKTRAMVNGWKNGEIPPMWFETVALKTGFSENWIKTGEGEKYETNYTGGINQEKTATFIPGLQHDPAPLKQREKNELMILRWLEKNNPDIRNRIADEIVEMYILGVKSINNR